MTGTRRFYRIVGGDPPNRQDFVPKTPRAIPRDPEKARLFSGLSTYETLAQARRRARESLYLGAWIAEITITPGVLVHYERTTLSNGHYTLWGDPDVILSSVTAVVPV